MVITLDENMALMILNYMQIDICFKMVIYISIIWCIS